MRARCWRRLSRGRGEFWHQFRIALVVEALLRKVDRNAPRERARRRRGILNDDNLQAERAEDRLKAGGPHPFLRGGDLGPLRMAHWSN
jgi:hypothetical protein